MKYHIINLSKEELETRSKFETFFTVPEIAKIIKKSEEQTRRILRDEKIQSHKVWKSYYVLESDLRDYMISEDRTKIEIYKFFEFEYKHQVKFYHPSEDLKFQGVISVLVNMLIDFQIPLLDNIKEELKSMYL